MGESPQSQRVHEWKQFSWQTPPIPADANRLSFGLQLVGVGTLTTDAQPNGIWMPLHSRAFGTEYLANLLKSAGARGLLNPGNHRRDPRHSGGCRGRVVSGRFERFSRGSCATFSTAASPASGPGKPAPARRSAVSRSSANAGLAIRRNADVPVGPWTLIITTNPVVP